MDRARRCARRRCAPRTPAGWTAALGGHRTIVWDNTPVNDATMAHELHLGPYLGRDADLADLVGGVLCNPMTQAARVAACSSRPRWTSSAIPTATTPPAAWAARVRRRRRRPRRAARGARPGVRRRAADRAGPRSSSPRWSTGSRPRSTGPGWVDAASPLAAELRAARALPEVVRGRRPTTLGAELAPWAAAARAHAAAGLAALRLIQQVDTARGGRPGGGVRDASRPIPSRRCTTPSHVTYTWMAARADEHVVYGPRFAVYSAVVQLPDGAGPALDVRASLREDANVIDRLCRLALGTYEAWRRAPGAAARARDRPPAVPRSPY